MNTMNTPQTPSVPRTDLLHPNYQPTSRPKAEVTQPTPAVSVPSFTYTVWPTSTPPLRIEALHPVDNFGPVPECVLFPKLQAPVGAKYCEEAEAFIPEELRYRIRGIGKVKAKAKAKQSLKSRFLGLFKDEEASDEMVIAMGVTHGKMSLVSLDEARHRQDIIYRGFDSEPSDDEECI